VIHDKGSDTMLAVAKAWAAAYDKALVEVGGGGSGIGIRDLIRGTVDIVNSSRLLDPGETGSAREHSGKDPVPFVVGNDAVAVYVHKDNPLEEIALEDLARIFGLGGDLARWSQLGITVPGCNRDEIVPVGRNVYSGTHDYFLVAILGAKGHFKMGILETLGSKDLVTLIANVPCAIGYSGMSFQTSDVKVLKIKQGGAPGVAPSRENVRNGTYPIARPLYMYTLGQPEGPVKEYIDWVRSDAGQEILVGLGYVPLAKMDDH
jgi:phosphate transport system substrate-binding protein